MKIKRADTEYEGETDELIRFFDRNKIDVPSLLNVPREFHIPISRFWIFGLLYFICLCVKYFITAAVWIYIINITCLIALTVLSFLIYFRFKNCKVSIWILIAGIILYLISTGLVTNQDIDNWTRKTIDSYLQTDSVT